VFVGTLALLTLGSLPSAQTEDTAKGASLLAEARKALGGEDKLAAVKRLQVKGEMRRGQGNNTLEGDTEEVDDDCVDEGHDLMVGHVEWIPAAAGCEDPEWKRIQKRRLSVFV
jgi:hypothetical protein